MKPDASSLIDEYIAGSPDYARPILEKARQIIVAADSDIREDWKWNVPHFVCEGIVCWLASFKTHVSVNFFKGALIEDKYQIFDSLGEEQKGNRIIKYTSIDRLHDHELKDYVEQAVVINRKGLKPVVKKKELIVPDYFMEKLKANPKAHTVFTEFPASYKRDYVEWIVEAKREATRDKRMAQALEWIAEGKERNWKYKK